MFTFEDPVGVQLSQAPDGTLTGTGCIVGAPGSTGISAAMPSRDGWCGRITGELKDRAASFGFTAPIASYSVRVTVSEDGRRMAGVFNNGVADLEYPMAWLRVAADAEWLRTPSPTVEDDPALGLHTLALVAADSKGGAFESGKAYRLGYTRNGIWGDLGSFWNGEMAPGTSTSAPDGARQFGPVPSTIPELPTSLSLTVEGGTIRGVTASTASGDYYTFTAARWQP